MNRLKLAMHIHTEWSFDAKWPLERVARAFKRRGYDAILTAEHSQSLDAAKLEDYRTTCARVSLRSGILLVPGVEYRDSSNTVHVPVWGDVPLLGDGLEIGSLLEEVSRHCGVAVLAHPARRDAHEMVDKAWAPLLSGVEAWNRKYDGWSPERTALNLSRELGLPMFFSLDFHGRRQFFPLSVRFDWDWPPSASAIYDAMRNGSMEPRAGYLPSQTVTSGPILRCLTVAENARKRLAPFLRHRG